MVEEEVGKKCGVGGSRRECCVGEGRRGKYYKNIV